jgi:uncharacterized membrane protein YbjE (DUF340 family)
MLLLALGVGIALGWLGRASDRAVRCNRSLTRYALWALLAFMGFKTAMDRALFTQDWGVLFLALGSSLMLFAFYVCAFWLYVRFRPAPRAAVPTEAAGPAAAGGRELWAMALNSAWIAAGFVAALLLAPDQIARLPMDRIGEWILRGLLVCVGFELGADLHKLDFRKLAPQLLLLPVLNIAMSLACGAAFSWFTRLSAREGALLYSGLGWYSLSSVLIAERGLALLSILAFLHNVLRELLTIVSMPLTARISPYLPIYLGGATSMDVTLPFIQRYCGRQYTLAAFYSGVICSLAVVPLVRMLLGG